LKSQNPLVIDLFCGAGGLSLGAARTGFDVRGAVDTDVQAMEAHEANFRNTKHLPEDVTQLTGKTIESAIELGKSERLSGVIGGPPCQGFSYIGRRNKHDRRNGLFVEFFRIVAETKPIFFLAENVPGIMRPENATFRETAISLVEQEYSVLPPLTVPANRYGAPTNRTRIFFFGYRSDDLAALTVESFNPPKDAEDVRVKDALEGLSADVDPLWQNESDGWRFSECRGTGYFAQRLHGQVPDGVGYPLALHRLKNEGRCSGNLGTRHSPKVAMRYAALRPGQRDYVSKSQRLDPDGFCPTLRAGTGPDLGSYQAVRPIHPTEPRVITPREAARLQGFPDWFTFSPSKWHSFRQIGSSVSPIVAERLMSVIHATLTR